MCSDEARCCHESERDCGCANILSSLLRPSLLLLIAEGAGRHGYELSVHLAELGLEVSTEGGRLYRALRHLEREGLVESAWEAQASGPARRVYTITEAGEAYLRNALASIDVASASLGKIAARIGKLG